MLRTYLRFICLVLLFVAARDLRAQVIVGTVVDAADGRPVASAYVTVMQNNAITPAFTDEKGTFRVFVHEGTFNLRVAALGFDSLDVRTLTIERLQRLTLTLTLGARPLEVAPVTVVSRRPQSRLGREGLTYRKDRADKSGMGRVLDEAAIARANAMFVSDVIRRQPFMNRSFSIPYRPGFVQMIGRGGRVDARGQDVGERGPTTFSSTPYGSNMGFLSPCGDDGYTIYVDGALTRLRLLELDNMFSPAELDGLEIYRRAMEVPGEFGGGVWGCGVIAVWTKR